jgi:hypothetical protein
MPATRRRPRPVRAVPNPDEIGMAHGLSPVTLATRRHAYYRPGSLRTVARATRSVIRKSFADGIKVVDSHKIPFYSHSLRTTMQGLKKGATFIHSQK